jgi:hypothetical protein
LSAFEIAVRRSGQPTIFETDFQQLAGLNREPIGKLLNTSRQPLTIIEWPSSASSPSRLQRNIINVDSWTVASCSTTPWGFYFRYTGSVGATRIADQQRESHWV